MRVALMLPFAWGAAPTDLLCIVAVAPALPGALGGSAERAPTGVSLGKVRLGCLRLAPAYAYSLVHLAQKNARLRINRRP